MEKSPTASFHPEVYAIDFGTSNSLLAAANAHQTVPPVPLDDGADDPSVLRTLLFFGQSEFSCGFGDIDVVCCTGGTARVPQIARGIEHRFGRGKVKALRAFHSVVQGLAEQARRVAISTLA